jgi:hypothetical protein
MEEAADLLKALSLGILHSCANISYYFDKNLIVFVLYVLYDVLQQKSQNTVPLFQLQK